MLQMPDDDPDIVFLSSSLNNMLVSGILKGINMSLLKAREDNNNEMATLLSTTRNRPPEIEHPLNQVERTYFHEIEIIDPKFFENLSIRQMKNFVNQVRLDGKKVDERFSRTYKLS